jgi:DNA-binding HxlR family transcriptional regulator
MTLLDQLGRRATLRVLWELRSRPLTFREIVVAAESNSSVVNTRLHELRGRGIVEHAQGGYRLTDTGKELIELLLPLDQWARRRMG